MLPVGGGGVVPWLTVIVTSELPVAPPLSVTVSRKMYEPSERLVIDVDACDGEPMVPPAGPEILVHEYDTIEPSASEPLPFNVVLFAGSVITWFEPALA